MENKQASTNEPLQPFIPDGQPALLLVDIQQGFDHPTYWGSKRNHPDAEKNAARLLEVWRQRGFPVIHVKHNSVNPQSPLAEGKPGNAIQTVVQPKEGEPVIGKTVNSAFIGTGLEQRLHDEGIRQLVVVGLTTDQCISTTVRMAGNLGFDTYVVNDATATFPKTGFDGKHYSARTLHETALASLNEEFATVLNTEDIIKTFI
ncbi:cysteine hydrolase family protein [Prolixibacter denitrificans]|uniref:Isochorismatase n=1 Tax=Prolixibacter denitrificans TaxID=1541063 RepID=A0A2P8CFB8_9BACT|nr:cysteine hydrolase family protein [Prolixibacter denitrificans]PSK83632.1 nicotinamidase-related amidase [Prolixibacter denitrificans]GET23180.1 isochorismatase [Prolixibacter denitrificans]